RLPGGGDEPGHVRRRLLPWVDHGRAADRCEQGLRHSPAADVPRRHGDPHRGRRRARHHEAARDADGDAPLSWLHPMSTVPRDYIERMIEQCAEAIAQIATMVRTGEFDRALIV